MPIAPLILSSARPEDNGVIGPNYRSLRIGTLIALRWLAVGGQVAAVVAAKLLLDVELLLGGCMAAIAASVWINAAATLAMRPNQRLSERDSFLSLLFDLSQLSVLLFLTGGLTNPFALFLLAPVTISASVLSLRTTLVLGGFSLLAASVLSQYYVPLIIGGRAAFTPPEMYLWGVWTAIALGVAFQAFYIRQVALEAFRMSTALAAAQMALEKEQRLSAVGALAAATAHELGTPLATIKLTAGELKRELADEPNLPPELAEDAALISEQAERCRMILSKISNMNSPEDAQIRSAPITTVLEEAAGPHRDRGKIIFRYAGAPFSQADKTQPLVPRRPEIIHGLRNLIQNAVDFSNQAVWVEASADDNEVVVTIADDGAGFSAEMLSRIGEPFATTRGRDAARGGDGYQGMGLGVFISQTLLERTGARLSFRNVSDPQNAHIHAALRGGESIGGAQVRVVWPHEALLAA